MQDFKGFLVVGQGNPSLANDKSSSLRQFYSSHQLTTGQRLASSLSHLSNQNRGQRRRNRKEREREMIEMVWENQSGRGKEN